MADSVIQDVSDTAFMVATYRALETERPDALFRDPFAAKLAGNHGQKIAASMGQRAFFAKWFVAIRTRIIDVFIEQAVAQGADTVLNLGAGLDARPYRMDLPASLHWIEVDYPKIIDFKTERLSGDTPRCRLERVALDLADAAARQQLFARIASQAENVLVLTEGVVPYLSPQEAGALADDLRARPAFRAWIVDYMSPNIRRYRRRTSERMRMANAPCRFDPQDYFAFFDAHGWRAKEIRYVAEEAVRLKRPLRLPFFFSLWVRLAAIFRGRRWREAFEKSVAYVRFEPGEPTPKQI